MTYFERFGLDVERDEVPVGITTLYVFEFSLSAFVVLKYVLLEECPDKIWGYIMAIEDVLPSFSARECFGNAEFGLGIWN